MKKNLLKILIFSFLFFGAFGVSKAEASLSCYVDTSPRSSNDVAVLGISSVTNAHAALPSVSTYSNNIYCGGVSGIGNLCSGNFETLAKLSGPVNAHVRAASELDYPGGNNACLSNSNSKASIEIVYQDDNCNGFDTELASLAKFPTNSHIGGPNDYPKKICASMSVPSSSSGGYLKNWGNGSVSGLVETVSIAAVSVINNVIETVQETTQTIIPVAKKIVEKTLASKEIYSSTAFAASPDSEAVKSQSVQVSSESLLATPISAKSKFSQSALALTSALLAVVALVFVGRRIFA